MLSVGPFTITIHSYEKFRIQTPRWAVWRYNALFQQTGIVELQQRVLAKEDGWKFWVTDISISNTQNSLYLPTKLGWRVCLERVWAECPKILRPGPASATPVAPPPHRQRINISQAKLGDGLCFPLCENARGTFSTACAGFQFVTTTC